MVDESQKRPQPRPYPIPIVSGSVDNEQQTLVQRSQSGEVFNRAPTNPSSVSLRKSRSHDDFLNQDEGYNPHGKRPSSWSSPNEPVDEEVVQRSSRLVDGEMMRLYDSVTPTTAKGKGSEIQGNGYNKLIYEGYSKKQLPPPQPDNVPLAALYSRLNAGRNPQAPSTSTSAPNTKPNQTIDTNKSARKTNDKEQMGYPMKELLPSLEVYTGPLYSNVNDEMNALAESQPTPTYSVPDMKKKREGRQTKPTEHPTFNEDSSSSPLYSNVDTERSTMSKFQMESTPRPVYSIPDIGKKDLPQRHQTVSFIPDPLYSNLTEGKSGLVQSTTATGLVYSIPDMQKKREGRQMKKEQKHPEYPMTELPPRHKTMFSSPLYSNSNAEMHPVHITQSQNRNQTYNVPSLTQYSDGNRPKPTGNTRGVQPSFQNTRSPSPPPLPLQTAEITELIQNELATTFGVGEARYPHVSVPASVRRGPTAAASEPSDSADIYDHPRRKDIYRPLPLEGLYDVPSSIPKWTYDDDIECNHYDMPSSLSLVAHGNERNETAMQGMFPGHGDEARIGVKGKREQ